MCGVFGIRRRERDVARLAYFGLFALQHRGQESAGIAVSDERAADGAARPRPRHPGLRRAEAARPPRRARDRRTRATRRRARRTGRTRSRSSSTAARARSRSGTTATSPTRTSCARSWPSRRDPALDLRHRGDRGADRERRRAARGGGRERDGQARGRLLGRRRSPRASWSRFRDRHGFRPLVLGRPSTAIRSSRPRPARSTSSARSSSARSRRASWSSSTSEGVACAPGRRAGRAPARSASSSSSTSRGPTRRLDGVEIHGARVRMGERLAARGAGRGRPRHADPRLGHAGRDRLLARERHPVPRGPDQEPLRRPHVHPARPGHCASRASS